MLLLSCQAPGTSTKSGDNDALKALLDEERSRGRHVGIAPQCAFNSYVWRSRLRDWWRLVYMPNTILMGLHRPGAVPCPSYATRDPSAMPLRVVPLLWL